MCYWAGHNSDLPFDCNISKMVRINIAIASTFFKEYSTRFLVVCRLIDFALVVLTFLIFKICVIIDISKTKFFRFSSTQRVKENQKNIEAIQNTLSLKVNHFLSNINKFLIFCLVFYWNFNAFAPWESHRREGHNTNLPSDSDISKTIRINIAFAPTFFHEYSKSVLVVWRLIDLALVVVNLLVFNVCLMQKPYFPSPGISWKAQKDQVNIIFLSTFWLKKDRISHSWKDQNKNFSVISKYHLCIIFFDSKKAVLLIPEKIKTELFSNQ